MSASKDLPAPGREATKAKPTRLDQVGSASGGGRFDFVCLADSAFGSRSRASLRMTRIEEAFALASGESRTFQLGAKIEAHSCQPFFGVLKGVI